MKIQVRLLVFVACTHAGWWGLMAADDHPFDTDACGIPSKDAPVIAPWRSIQIDADYGGLWIVAGDVDNDGEIEIVSAKNVNVADNHYTSSIVAQELDGAVRWRWGDPKSGRRELHHDVACQIHDLDHDGTREVILAADRKVVVLNGTTGEPKSSFPIEQHASDCIAFADLSGRGWPSEILVKNRYEQIWAYSSTGQLLWTVKEPGGYRTSHQPFPVDLDGDGRDEILAGYAALNPDGSIRWVFEAVQGKRNGGHADCWRVVRLAKTPGETRLVLTMCSGNAIVMSDGAGVPLWSATGHHYESVDVGEIRPDVAGLEIVVDVDHLPKPPMPLCVFSEAGDKLGQIRTDYTRHHTLVDWNGDGLMEIGSAMPLGIFDGRGQRVCTFTIGEKEEPAVITTIDLGGRNPHGILLTTTRSDGCKVYIYRSGPDVAQTGDRPQGTKSNFTLY